ncbi:transposase [Sulfurovum sp.]|uniref:transposase n=1 Tax=Sulfurovum sp. TaxID=1969726 RepID=UPI0025CBCD81|nr:transposase [Sulfurovum sp.]
MKNIIPSLSKMWLKVLNLEQSLFPQLQDTFGPLSPKEERLIKILDFAEIETFVSTVQITNPPKDREEMARAFVAKSVYNFQTTRALIERLEIDKTLRMLCGWRYHTHIPSESKFSRVFDAFSRQRIASKAQDVFIEKYLSDVLFFYGSTDSTAIELREKPVKKEKCQEVKPKRKRGRPKKGEVVPAKEPTILEQQETMQTCEEMLSLISTQCDVGIKQNAKGYRHTWIGGKLHMTVVDGDIPIAAMYSSASIHDSSLAMPMIKDASSKINYLYDLQDAAYDSGIIRAYSEKQGHRPIIDINPKNSKVLKEQIALAKSEKEILQSFNLYNNSDELHYNQRSSAERVNAYLKDNFGCNKIYYRGATKIASVLAFGILSVCIHQSLKLVT